MNTPTIDYAADAVKTTSEAEIIEISTLCQEQMELEDELERAEAEVERVKEKLRAIREKTLPDRLRQTGLSEVRLTQGHKLVVKDMVFATIKEENKEQAFSWLRDHNFGDLIKNQVIVSFGKG